MFVHDKTKFAKPPQEGYLSLGHVIPDGILIHFI